MCTGDDQRVVVAVQGLGHAGAVARLIRDQVDLPPSRVAVVEAGFRG